jgi:hypothetical protein
MDFASFCLQLIDKALGFGRVPARDANLVSAFGKSPCDGGTDGIARANQQNHFTVLIQGYPPTQFLFDT